MVLFHKPRLRKNGGTEISRYNTAYNNTAAKVGVTDALRQRIYLLAYAFLAASGTYSVISS